MKKLVIFCCNECKCKIQQDDLYCDENGDNIHINDIEFVDVGNKLCRCGGSKHSISIECCGSKPWSVVFWENEWARNEGEADLLGNYETFEEAYNMAVKGANINAWASCEVQIKCGEDYIPVYCYATTEPYADEFIIS